VLNKLTVGDVLLVPTGDGRAGVGQVVATYGKDAYFFAIFDRVLSLEEAPDQAAKAVTRPLLLLACSFDAKLHAGHWTIVAHSPVDPTIPLLAYKEVVGWPPKVDVVDHSGTQRRSATQAEADSLPNRKIISPAILEKAFRASVGLEPWLPAFDELRSDRIVPSSSICQ